MITRALGRSIALGKQLVLCMTDYDVINKAEGEQKRVIQHENR